MGFPRVLFLAVLNILLFSQTVYGDFNFSKFNENLEFILIDSNIASGALQVTEETLNTDPQYSKVNKSGRVIYDKAYRFWKEDGVPVSFNSTFVLNLKVENGSGGEGMAFFITSNIDITDKPEDSYGFWMGLFNSSTNGQSSNQMVAVEFDTVKNNGTNDPDGNHIGINVNNINSTNITSLEESQIDLKSGNDITVWIQFHGDKQKLNVYLANGALNDSMPSQPFLSQTLDLSSVLDSEVHFGFSASTSDSIELHCVKSWSLSIETVSKDKKVLVIILSLVAGLLFVVAVVIVLFWIKYRKSRAEEADIAGTIQNLPGHPREFKYTDLKKATNNFSAQSQLGSGGPPFVWPYPEFSDSSSTGILISQESGSAMNWFMKSPAVREEESSLT
ncbi:hypothetical protein SUGI_0496110 [Cryptomeria japonica]|nr:hypothetical protein SUGI_0496110 [Cryptomeria japonica]